MKFMHIADLHIGKRVNEFSMIEEQKYILDQIVSLIDARNIQGVLIAGDIYDKSVPSVEAVQLFDEFLTKLAARALPVFLIYGNHDSPERIAYGGRMLKNSGIYVSPVYHGVLDPVILTDEYGEIAVYLLPFLKPAHVKHAFAEAEVTTYEEALSYALSKTKVDKERRNILLAHQFVAGAKTCESEEISIGGLDQISASVFADFDYVALGHLHGAQRVERDTIRYAGSPLKYSFSEIKHKKSVVIVEVREKGNIEISLETLKPKRELQEIKGLYMDITKKSYYSEKNTQDYFHITLTDEEDIPDALGKLRSIYPNLMKLDYDNKRTKQMENSDFLKESEHMSPLTLFQKFYRQQNQQDMSPVQSAFVENLIESIWEGGK